MLFSLYHVEREQALVVQSSTCIAKLQRLRDLVGGPPLDGFSSWADAKCWLDGIGPWREETDVLLRPLLSICRERPDQSWHDILVFLFWRSLMRIYGRTLPLDLQSDQRFSLVYWYFAQTVQRLDLQQRPQRLGAKILQDVWHDVREYYKRERDRQELHDPMPDELAPREAAYGSAVRQLGREDSAFREFEFRHDSSWAIARLRNLVRAGELSRADCLILIGCHLYGYTLEEMADRQGLSYEAAKKRRQRAVQCLEIHAPQLSPDLPDGALFPMRRAPRKEQDHD